MKKLSLFLISAFFLFKSSLAFSYDTDPQKFVTELIQDAISKLSDNNSTEDEKKEFIEKIAIENVDISALGLYTLGDLRKKVSKDELKQYQGAFEKYFLKSLTSRLSDYSSNQFEVIGADKKCKLYYSEFKDQRKHG